MKSVEKSQASVSISLITVNFSLLIVLQEEKRVELVRTINSFLWEEISALSELVVVEHLQSCMMLPSFFGRFMI